MIGGASPESTRVQTPYLVAEDELDRSLRPRRLEDFVGPEALREQLSVALEAATARGEALDHLLLAGPPGLGKTSLAHIVAAELDVAFVQTAGPALERKGDIAAFLTALEPRSVFFVDEIHRLSRALEETFYPAMEDRRLPITVGQGVGARVVTLDLPPFTLVGATTRTGLLTTPLRERFGIQARLEPYAAAELALIVRRAAGILGIELEPEGAQTIAARSRGTPRVANRLLKRVRDFAEVRMEGTVTARAAERALEMLEVDERGLDRLDREILRTICEKFDGGPVGLSTLAIAVGEEPDTLEDVYEPYLLTEGLIKRTPRGRAAIGWSIAVLSEPAPARAGRRSLHAESAGGSGGVRASGPAHGAAFVVCRTMAHPFICPNCGHRTSELDRNLGFTRSRKGCAKCGFAFLFELLDDYYPAPDAAFFVCDGEGRVIGCGKNSFAFTGLEEENVIGQRVEQVLGLQFENGDDPVKTVL